MILKTVTLTGADDGVQPEQLFEISEQYPFVEWAILLSKNSEGQSRFPSQNWMKHLTNLLNTPARKSLRVAGHLCGSYLRNLMKYGKDDFKSEIPLWPYLSRIQLNFHAEPFEVNAKNLQTLRHFTWDEKKKFIIQMDNVNNHLYEELLNSGVLVEPLFDLSHGTGILPEKWPENIPSVNPHAYRGYAGGLNPENFEAQLIKLAETVGPDIIWVDMETGIRSGPNSQFDLAKVTAVLEIAKKYINNEGLSK